MIGRHLQHTHEYENKHHSLSLGYLHRNCLNNDFRDWTLWNECCTPWRMKYNGFFCYMRNPYHTSNIDDSIFQEKEMDLKPSAHVKN